MSEEQKKRGMTAQEFLEGLGQERMTKTLSNGLTIEMRRVDVMQIFTKNGALVPAYGEEKSKDNAAKSPEVVKKAVDNMNEVLFASIISPRFVPGTESNPEKNEIGIDHPLLSSGVKAELLAVVLEFNGFSGIAATFFRLVGGESMDGPGSGVQTVRKSTARVPQKKHLGTRVRRIGGKTRPKGRA